ncbi:serine/threonine protein kinase [Streptomyces mobaraensis NBRC 13819 = DSM 40847]|uniref:non-specific serine/threonine protein kinase n=1 Tax=Streptomyces mobaraensis (strain ATCC 29032 / DSM 40847 / JCM 4168 / NBRC 13819 / NCIMB 11159 / IPCR 16-22) TaxID=1223523 RepID=M3C6F7_STRM1|nr:serine/threonine protein kinase [Streptomyces mobaraensis NBRC 13819 = DSM 40847]
MIAGRYRLERRIGRGGMGTVWRATDELLGREVAVKELHTDDAASVGAALSSQERTLREARAVALIKHPNVIVLHDIVEQDGRPWIVMELVDGRSLADRLAADGPVDAREAARIGLAMLGALRAAHERGVLHRDIKPPNVLLEAGSGRVVLTDFGIARVSGATTITETGAFVGSPEYTAPERMAGGQAGPESDLWSLGVLLCTVLSGESPFHRDSLGGILHAVVYDEIRPPTSAGPLLPVVRGLLERDPARRMGADEAERLLRGYLDTGRTPAASLHYTPTQRGVPTPTPAAPADPRVPAPAPGASNAAPAAPSPSGPPTPPTPAATAEARPEPPAAHPATPPGTPPATPPAAFVPPPGPSAPRRTVRIRTAVLAGVAVVTLAGLGAGVAAWLMLRGDGERDDARGPAVVRPARPSAAGSAAASARPGPHGPAAGASAGTPATGPAASAGSETPPPGSPTPPASPAAGKAPEGYHVVRDPMGFTLAVPDGYTRSLEPPRVFYYSPDKEFRIGVLISDPKDGGPIGFMRDSASQAPDHYPGYRDGRVTRTTHNGNQAASWEFTWDGFEDTAGPRHTEDVCWNEGGKMYDVWVSAPAARSAEGRRQFDTVLRSFGRSG